MTDEAELAGINQVSEVVFLLPNTTPPGLVCGVARADGELWRITFLAPSTEPDGVPQPVLTLKAGDVRQLAAQLK